MDLARGIAMHVAAMNPPYNKAADVPADFLAKEKEIELAKMTDKERAKPAEILEKIIGGKVQKIVNEVTLYGQAYRARHRQDGRSRAEGRGRRRDRLLSASPWAKASRRWWKTTPPKSPRRCRSEDCDPIALHHRLQGKGRGKPRPFRFQRSMPSRPTGFRGAFDRMGPDPRAPPLGSATMAWFCPPNGVCA
jgi:hypothetical protein